jgi:hypothetical protein
MTEENEPNNKNKGNSNSFLKGTLILTVGGIVVKVIGFLNWIILSRVLGGEGIGFVPNGLSYIFISIKCIFSRNSCGNFYYHC